MRRIVIANVYRPPSGNLPNAIRILSDAFNKIDSQKYPETYIMGDLNVDFAKFNANKTKICNMCAHLGLRQLINKITRFNITGNHTTIDLVLTNSVLV